MAYLGLQETRQEHSTPTFMQPKKQSFFKKLKKGLFSYIFQVLTYIQLYNYYIFYLHIYFWFCRTGFLCSLVSV